MLDDQLKLTVYDKAFKYKGRLGNPVSVVATPGHNMLGETEVVFDTNHPRAAKVLEKGARLKIEMPGRLSLPLMTGPIVGASQIGPAAQSRITVTIEDDIRILWNTLGFQVPGSPVSNQAGADYKTYTGSAEKIVKDMVRDNVVNRLGRPVTIAPNKDRGATIPGGIKIRMHQMPDRLLPAIEQAGIGLRFYQSGAGFTFDVYETRVFPRKLSEASGTLLSWAWNTRGPSLTRVVVGGQGEGKARTFRSRINTALEAEYGDIIEGFVDARDAETVTELDQRGDEALLEARPTSGLSLELSETENFNYGKVLVGDTVTIAAGGTTITDLLRTATIAWTAEDGLVTTPTVGAIEDDTDAKTMTIIRKLWQGLTDLKAR